jgi:DNA-binding NarL/FixJ family response regulator
MISSAPAALIAAAPTLLRQGLIATLREQWPQLRLVLTADASEIAELVGQASFRLLVLDEELIGRALPELLARLYRARPTLPLIILTERGALARSTTGPPWPGTSLHVPRHALPHALVAQLVHWLDAPTAVAVPVLRPRAAYALFQAFSKRELEVLRLVVADCCNEEIADLLCVSVRTIESHRRALLQKAGTRTLVGLAARAVREGWVA